MDAAVYIVGGGGHGKVIAGILRDLHIPIAGVFDDRLPVGTALGNGQVVGTLPEFANFPSRSTILAIGDNRFRERFSLEQRFRSLPLVHPRSYLAPTVMVGVGSVVCAGATITEDVVIGRHCIVNTAASVDHDCRLGDFVHVACGVTITGDVIIEDGVFIGAGATILPQVKIGAWAVVGAGATVTKDVPAGWTVVGTPAVRLGNNNQA